MSAEMSTWTRRDSAELYGISGWGKDFFDINEAGHVELTAAATKNGPIDLKRVVDDLVRRGLSLPILLRFPDVLERRVEQICDAFKNKIEEFAYEGQYQLVMPIKVNQQRYVVEELLSVGDRQGVGLEAGSKPELLVAIAQMPTHRPGLIVCNGYKDQAYIETALLAQRMGIQTLIIVDRFAELGIVVEASKRLGIKPNIGVRTKLASRGSGRWADSGGERSKFGLTATEIVATVQLLREENMLDTLVAQHFHIGSQITSIRSIKEAIGEAARIFTDISKMGAPLKYLDVGGGLAVDYDGSRTNFHASKNYSLEEYAADVVYALGTTLTEAGVPHPTIISESGRALVAHHSVLVFNVVDHTRHVSAVPMPRADEEEHQLLEELREVEATVSRKNLQEAFHDALQLKEDANSLFRHGILDLEDRAVVEALFSSTMRKIGRIAHELDYVPEDLDVLERMLADTYYCNFSLFQSVPDAWAVKALFPVMPIHRLCEKPVRRGVLADLTCDSDGKMDQFIGLHDVKDAVELHSFSPDEPYFLGIFLVGAYQEILGDLHNLFGDVHAIHVTGAKDQPYVVKHVIEGDRVRDVLGYVSYDERHMMQRIRGGIESALTRGEMTFEQSAALVRHFEGGLAGYTYLEDPNLAETLRHAQHQPPKPEPISNGEEKADDGDDA